MPNRVLVLHGNKQVAKTFQKKTQNVFQKMIGLNMSLIYTQSPKKYISTNKNDNRRCWWNATDDIDNMIYEGVEESISFIDSLASTINYGPIDGIIGFSQGGTLAAIIAYLISNNSDKTKIISKNLKFVIIISGFYPRDIRYKFTKRINIPSFHIWGEKDVLILPERSKMLGDFFISRMEYIHENDHYIKAISAWPTQQVFDWILDIEKQTIVNITHDPIDNILNEFNKELGIYKSDYRKIKPGKYVQMIIDMLKIEKSNIIIEKCINDIPCFIIILCKVYMITDHVEFKNALIDVIAKKFHEYITGVKNYKTIIIHLPSKNAKGMYHTELPKYIMRKLITISGNISSFLGYDTDNIHMSILYTALINKIKNDLVPDKKERSTLSIDEQLLLLPSSLIINPEPEPVDISTDKELEQMHTFLRIPRIHHCSEKDVIFTKGTLCKDGRLDLCKQVIGPQGINALEESLIIDGLNKNPYVKSILLGNNIAGPLLGTTIANLIKNKSTSITVWYIAGNNLTASAMKELSDSLIHDKQVTQLWLKRNPIKLAGAISMTNMLTHNNYLKILDLTNTGLLNEGTEVLCKAISINAQSAIEILYLNANGISTIGCKAIVDMLKINTSIIDIDIGCNRLGNENIIYFADNILTNECRLKRLSIPSCGITSHGAIIIAKCLEICTSLSILDMGFFRSTNVLLEVQNAIGNDGAMAMSNMLRKNTTLLSLDLLNNRINQEGISSFIDCFSINKTLLSLIVDKSRQIESFLERNKSMITSDEFENFTNQLHPSCLLEIISVYRNGQDVS
jgi:Ran GTPase-activating protein (RanGAP) involved in mRNA processing and transport/predicted esterase